MPLDFFEIFKNSSCACLSRSFNRISLRGEGGGGGGGGGVEGVGDMSS